jgi:hypothetical protein
MTPTFLAEAQSIVEPLLTRLGFQADGFDDQVDEGGRYGAVVFYRSSDCKLQVYLSTRQGQINSMIAPLDAPNVFGPHDRSRTWRIFTMVVERQGVPREKLMQDNPAVDFPTETQSLEWVRGCIAKYFPYAHTGILEESGTKINDSVLSIAIVEAIGHTAAPHADKAKLIEIYGDAEGGRIAAQVLALVAEANSLPIEWGEKTLEQAVNDIMSRFRKAHPGLSVEALREIGRCVGWNWR